MCQGLLISMAWNWHDVLIRDTSIGPQGYGGRSDAVDCVYGWEPCHFADFLYHVGEGVNAQRPMLKPHVVFRSKIWLRILEKRIALRFDLFKIELKRLVVIVAFGWFVHPSFFLVTGRVLDTTWMVLQSFIMGQVTNLRPAASVANLKFWWWGLFVLHGLFGRRKDNMELDISKKRKQGRKRKNATGF